LWITRFWCFVERKTIAELWASPDQSEWLRALSDYYKNRRVLMIRELEETIKNLTPDGVQAMGEHEWYEFLRDVFFPWKFRGNYLPQKVRLLRKHENKDGLAYLMSTKERLFNCDLTKYSGRAKALETARGINGLGQAGASCLLAVIFPASVGGADKMVVRALHEIPGLPERPKLPAIKRDSQGNDNANLTDAGVLMLVEIMRRKAAELNALFHTSSWTPRMIDMILWDHGTKICSDPC